MIVTQNLILLWGSLGMQRSPQVTARAPFSLRGEALCCLLICSLSWLYSKDFYFKDLLFCTVKTKKESRHLCLSKCGDCWYSFTAFFSWFFPSVSWLLFTSVNGRQAWASLWSGASTSVAPMVFWFKDFMIEKHTFSAMLHLGQYSYKQSDARLLLGRKLHLLS